MLVYNPAFDLYHTILRILKVESRLRKELEIERVRIYDFLFLFPMEMKNIRFSKKELSLKYLIPKNDSPYSEIIDSGKLFKRMEPFQITAIKSIVSLGLFDKAAFEAGYIKRMNPELPKDIAVLVNNIDPQRKNALVIISQFLDKLELFGEDGLKSRTSLIEYRYDPK